MTAMIHHYSEKNRSALCHIITDFHSANQKRVARFDLWGVLVSAVMASLLVEFVRLLVSH
jgi:hypothetical protein